jgi:hypothetical protein
VTVAIALPSHGYFGSQVRGYKTVTNVITARENLGPEAHESKDSVENPREWLWISHVVRAFWLLGLQGSRNLGSLGILRI